MENLVRERIRTVRSVMLAKAPFWGYLSLHLEICEDVNISSIKTDGNKLIFNPNGPIKQWSDIELLGVIAHEVAHCALGHLWSRGSRNPLIWNFATDYAINWLLKKDGFSLPRNCIISERFADCSAEYIYSELLKDWGDSKREQSGIIDDISMWDDVDLVEEKGDDYWQGKLKEAIKYNENYGHSSFSLAGYFDKLLEPTIPWEEVLHDYLTLQIDCDYKLFPPNKKFLWVPLYLPRIYGVNDAHLEIVVAIDTSGSISNDTAKGFLSEVHGIMEQFDSYLIHYIQCDANVTLYEQLNIDNRDDFQLNQILGRGGTSFIPVFDKVEELGIEPNILIYMTDLKGQFPDNPPQYPVLWVTNDNKKVEVPFGDLLSIC